TADPCNVGNPNDIVYAEIAAAELVGVPSIVNNDGTLTLFPNPTNGIATIHFGNEVKDDVRMTISNILGQVIKNMGKVQIQDQNVQIDASDLADGLYYLNVTTEKEVRTISFNIVK
nr:T9SS type A sorting domain-containing protein [Chitinophagales bacterium]